MSDEAREFLALLVNMATARWSSPWVLLTPDREPLVDELRAAGVTIDVLASEPRQARFPWTVLS